MPILEGKFAQDPGVLSTTSILGQGNSALLALLGQATQIGARINANQLAQEGNFLAERGRLDTLMETQRQFDLTSAQRKREFDMNTARSVLEFNSRNNLEKQKMADINKRDIRDTQENNARYDKALGFTIEDRARAEKERQANLDFINKLTGSNKATGGYDFVGPRAGGASDNLPEDFVGPRAGGPSSFSSDPSLLSGFNLADGSESLLPPPGSFNTGSNFLPSPVIPPAGYENLLPLPEAGTGGLTTPNGGATYAPGSVRESVLNKLLNVDSEDLGKGMMEGTVAPTDAIEVARFKAQTADEKLANAKRLEALLDTKGMTGEQKFILSGLVKKLNVEGKNESADAKKLSQSAWKLLTKTDTKTSSSTILDNPDAVVTPEEYKNAQTTITAIKNIDPNLLTAKVKDIFAKAALVEARYNAQKNNVVDTQQVVDPKEVPNADGSFGNNKQALVTENDKKYNEEKVNSLEKLKAFTTSDGSKPPASIFLEILKEANKVTSNVVGGGNSYFSASENLVKAIGLPKETIDNTLNAKDPKTGRTVLESFLDSVANEGNRFAFQKAGLGDVFDPLRYTAKKNNYLDIKGDPAINAGEEFLKKANLQGTKK